MEFKLKNLGLALVLALGSTLGVKAVGEEQDPEMVQAEEILASPDKRSVFTDWARHDHRKALMRTIVTTAGGIAGGLITPHVTKPFAISDKDGHKMRLFKNIAFDKPIGDICAAIAGLGFDSIVEKALEKETECDLPVSDVEKAVFYTATNAVGTFGDFLSLYKEDKLSPSFGPPGLSVKVEGHEKSKARYSLSDDDFNKTKKSDLDTKRVPALFALSMALRGFKEGQYKDFVGKGKALPEVLTPACDQVSNLTKFLDLEKMSFVQTGGIRDQNKLINKAIVKTLAGMLNGRVFEKKGKQAKYNEFLKSVSMAVAGPFFAVAIDHVHGEKKNKS